VEFLALLVLAALLVNMTATVAHPNGALVSLLVVLDVIWLFTNNPIEGPVLIYLSAGHGITFADLLVPASVPVLAYGISRA
jgi:hypothetical protein